MKRRERSLIQRRLLPAGVLLFLAMLTACTAHDDLGETTVSAGDDAGEQAIVLTSTLAGTRAYYEYQTNQIDTSVTVAAFGVSDGKTIKYGNNNQYAVESSGMLTAKKKDMIWPKDEEARVNIYAYAPYHQGWVYNQPDTFTVDYDQCYKDDYLASDLIYASAYYKKQQKDPVQLNFRHMMTRINLIIQQTPESNAKLKNAEAYIANIKRNTMINPSIGSLSEAFGDYEDIKIGQYLNIDSENPDTLYGIIVPQRVLESAKFIRIVTDSIEYFARLPKVVSFQEGMAYDFTATVDITQEMDLELGSVSLIGWETPTALDTKTKEVTNYGIGDYVLADGSLLKADDSNFESKKSDIIAVIFSKDVSEADMMAGYAGYAMGLTRVKNRSWYAGGSYGFGVSGLEAAIGDLDGRSHTEEFLSSDLYKHITDSLAQAEDTRNIHICNMDDYELKIDESASNLSGWFCPSFGQFVQILNNLGGAKITNESITSKNDKGVVSFSNWGTFYRYSDDTSASKVSDSKLVDNINAYVTKTGKGNIVNQGNISIPTFTENANRGGSTYFEFSLKQNNVKDADGNVTSTSYDWEMTAAQGKWSDSSNAAVGGKSVLPVLAFKLPENIK